MVSERAQAGSRQNQRRATRGSQGILCPAYNSMMQTLPRAVARGLLFAFLRAVWAGKLDGQAPPSANAMKCAEIAFLPFYTAAPRTRPHPSFHPSARRNARLRERSVKRCTSPIGAKYRHRRNACLQEHFDDAAHELQRGEVSEAIPSASVPYEEIPPLHSVPCSG